MITDKIELNETKISLEDKIIKPNDNKKFTQRYFTLNNQKKNKINDSIHFQRKSFNIKNKKKKKLFFFILFNNKFFLLRNLNKLDVSVDKEILKKYESNAELIHPENAKTKVASDRLALRKKRFIDRVENTARAELLNDLETGFFFFLHYNCK